MDYGVKHVAVIMDGNGRWATEKGQIRSFGHRAGVESLVKIVEACPDLGIKYLTVYAFSTENWKRPEAEVKTLMFLLDEFIDKKLQSLIDNEVKINVLGDVTALERKLQDKLAVAIDKTKDFKRLNFSIAMNYGGRAEIVRASKEIATLVKEGKLSVDSINEETFNDYLYTKNMPDPELLIRTGGDLRTSNFLPWQLVYSEFYSTPVYWPDFTPFELEKALMAFTKRDRRFGGLSNAN